ncbi:hypothetical protein N9872_00835 [Paraglaciecola sp.]|nr:hypothetical protein [Paraglaciecola sp.]MDB4281503.1 hypothetical protein [Paraglaciecola sp.]
MAVYVNQHDRAAAAVRKTGRVIIGYGALIAGEATRLSKHPEIKTHTYNYNYRYLILVDGIHEKTRRSTKRSSPHRVLGIAACEAPIREKHSINKLKNRTLFPRFKLRLKCCQWPNKSEPPTLYSFSNEFSSAKALYAAK